MQRYATKSGAKMYRILGLVYSGFQDVLYHSLYVVYHSLVVLYHRLYVA